MQRILLATALSSVLLISTAHAGSNSFFTSLSGSWSGSGQAYLKKLGEISANCRLAITGAETQIAMKGSCGALVFRQALGLTIKNAGGNRYVGTYTGGGKSQGIYQLELDNATGTLKPLGLAGAAVNPAFLAIHPGGRFLYAVGQITDAGSKEGGAVNAFSVNSRTGKLTPGSPGRRRRRQARARGELRQRQRERAAD